MPSPIAYPGVYVEEVSVRNRISRLRTSTTAFVGDLPSGALNQPAVITTLSELDGAFGAGAASTATGISLAQFLANGGRTATVIRTAAAGINDALTALPDHVDLLLLPDTAAMSSAKATESVAAAQAWASSNGAMYIIDPPALGDVADIQRWAADVPARDRNSVLYHPWLTVGDSTTPPGGAVAGVYRRTDEGRGVWKAPAGVEASLLGGTGLTAALTEDDVRTLTGAGVNAIRNLGAGPTLWGARTLSSDPEWKYVSVRRLGLLIENSIVAGTQWVVFEPNDAPLWATVEQAVDDFLEGLWRDGALQGEKASDAYFVRVGRTTMTTADIDRGRLIVEIGFAPLKPAEFVVIRIEQQTSTAAGLPGTGLSQSLSTARSLGPGASFQMVFAGPSRAAKTAAAQGLSAQLGRPLVRVNLPQLAASYIGETEKNLTRLLGFAAARESILFFDEADSLFGRRKRAKSSRERVVSGDTSKLRERINRYPGLVIFGVEHAARSAPIQQIIEFGKE